MGAKLEISPGDVFGGWTLIEEVERNPNTGERRWRVQCNECRGTCVRDQSVVRRATAHCMRCARQAKKRAQRQRGATATNVARRKSRALAEGA